MKYKAIIFDFGGIIINIDFALTHAAFQEFGVNDLEEKFSQTQQSGFFDKFEKGDILPEDFRTEIKKYLNLNITDPELNNAWNKMLLDIPRQRIDWVLNLKSEYKCVLLSNTNEIHYDFYRQNLEKEYGYKKFSNIFDKTYFSHEIGLRKPDNNIYNFVLDDINLKPSEILFIDDTEKNILAARALGWNCILWKPGTLDLLNFDKITWLELKTLFINALSKNYEQREVEGIFFLIIDELYQLSRIIFQSIKGDLIEKDKITEFASIILELMSNKPIQHVLGYGYFFERKFKVSPDVLIPRQETEELVDLIIRMHKKENINILDIGTGTGCIPITLKLENPDFNMKSIDISINALKVAQENAKELNAKVEFQELDILNEDNWGGISNNSLDIIVSNPPYVRELEKTQMHNNVLNFDPELALFVDDDNALIFYEKITKMAYDKLKPNGFLYFEINEAFGKETKKILEDNGFNDVVIYKDLQGKDRIVYGNLA